MRSAVLRGVIGAIVCTGWIGMAHAAGRPSWYPSDDAIAARMKVVQEQQKSARAYYERELAGQYKQFGQHAPKWDQLAIDLINANLNARIGVSDDARAIQQVLAGKCMETRPEDAFVYYLSAVAEWGSRLSRDFQRQDMRAAANGVIDSPYKGIIRLHALIRSVESSATSNRDDMTPLDLATAEDRLAQALSLLDEVSKDKDLPPYEIRSLLWNAGSASQALYNDRWKWASQVYDALIRNRGECSELLAAKGAVFAEYAWDARSDGWAAAMTDESRQLMNDRLAVAEKDLTQAWDMNPEEPAAAIQMLGVELLQGKGRDVMERWFRRAVAIDPTQMEPYERKRRYLERIWHGSDEEMLGFAREVAAAVPKTSQIRLIVWSAHNALAHYLGEDRTEAQKAYYQEHPEAWKEIKAVADDVVLAKGTSNHYRAEMVCAAVAAGDMASARAYAAVTDKELARKELGTEYPYVKGVENQRR